MNNSPSSRMVEGMFDVHPITPRTYKPANWPWFAHRKSPRANNFGVYDGSGSLIASIAVHQLAKPERRAMHFGQAKLMASAPKLLDALHTLIEKCGFESANGTPAFHAAVEQARAAITEATEAA